MKVYFCQNTPAFGSLLKSLELRIFILVECACDPFLDDKRGQDYSRFNDRVGIDEKNSSPSRFSFAQIYVRLTICPDSIRRRMTAAKKVMTKELRAPIRPTRQIFLLLSSQFLLRETEVAKL